MKEMSYELLDLMDQYGEDEEGISRILETETEPWVLLALSPLRENLVEWLPVSPADRVLELGAGYGALTGALARKAGEVVVLDHREENLEVSRRRWRQMKNIRWEKETDGGFDWVMLVGPKTRAARLGIPAHGVSWNQREKEKADLKEQINQGASWLKAGGRLVLSLPNRDGIKYWAGAELEEEEMSLTWGELKELFASMGGKTAYYYPLPDYKMPTAIYSDQYLPAEGEIPSLYAEYEKPRYRLFSEEAAYGAICQAGGFPQFANSFLVIWEKV